MMAMRCFSSCNFWCFLTEAGIGLMDVMTMSYC